MVYQLIISRSIGRGAAASAVSRTDAFKMMFPEYAFLDEIVRLPDFVELVYKGREGSITIRRGRQIYG